MSTQEARARSPSGLLGELGISEREVPLLDAVPLVGMCWADGQLRPEELDELHAFVEAHVKRVNEEAGRELLSRGDAQRFLARFLREKPSPTLLRELTRLLPTVSLTSEDPERNRTRRQAILGGCLDVGSAAPDAQVVRRRFSPEEKAWYAEVAQALEERA
jgi:hypothetical protein